MHRAHYFRSLEGDAELVAVEVVLLGHTAMGEPARATAECMQAAAGQRLRVNRRDVLGVSSLVARTASIRSTSSETGPALSHA